MVGNATKLSHHEFRITVKRWEMLADMDGAHKTAEQAHEGRTAGIVEVGEEIHLHGRGGLAQGAVMKEIFDRFCDAEFSADWEQTLARFGDNACYSLMPRSDAQRRFDAIYAIFERAAAVDPGCEISDPAGQPRDRRAHHRARTSPEPATSLPRLTHASGAAKPSPGSQSQRRM